MARISSRPWIAPSSPGRPCSRLSATSGLRALSVWATSRSTSTRLTRKPPCRSSAAAQAAPERNETSRSADQPPMRTATCWVMVHPRGRSLRPLPRLRGRNACEARQEGASRGKRPPLSHSPPQARRRGLHDQAARTRPSARHPNTLDLPLELDAARLAHPSPHLLAERLDVRRRGVAAVDQEVAVHLRHLGVADDEAAAAGGVDELPGLVAGRVLEGRAAGPALDRLRRLARRGDLVHLGRDRDSIAGAAAKEGLGEDHVLGRAAVAVAVVHVAIGKDAYVARAVDAACLDQDILGLGRSEERRV